VDGQAVNTHPCDTLYALAHIPRKVQKPLPFAHAVQIPTLQDIVEKLSVEVVRHGKRVFDLHGFRVDFLENVRKTLCDVFNHRHCSFVLLFVVQFKYRIAIYISYSFPAFFRQPHAPVKRPIVDMLHASGNVDFLQRAATGERITPDGFQVFRQSDIL
jgi:hypothetical protein